MGMRVFKTIMLLLSLFLPVTSWAGSEVEVSLDNSIVDISAFYNGTTIQASGTVPAGAEVAIVVSGRPENLHVKKKGKIGGLLWMNVGDLTFENAPRVYMIYTSDGAKDAPENAGLDFSFPALESRVRVEPESDDKHLLFGEFLKLEEMNRVYASYPGTITIKNNGADGQEFKAELIIPPRMGQGEYRVAAYAIGESGILGEAAMTLTVRQVGFPEKLSELAFGNATLYGILSVLVAIGAGFAMGTIFKDKEGGGAH